MSKRTPRPRARVPAKVLTIGDRIARDAQREQRLLVAARAVALCVSLEGLEELQSAVDLYPPAERQP